MHMASEPTRMTHPTEAFLSAVRDHSPATTAIVAEDVGVTRQGADYRLRSLREDGVVESDLVGNTLVWSVVEEAAEETRDTDTDTDTP